MRSWLGHLPRWLREFAEDRRGAVYVWVAGGLIGILGLAGMAIDTGFLYVLRNQTQIAADAAALAAVVELPDKTDARKAAKDYAELNMPQKGHGKVLEDSDIVIGNWANGAFAPGAAPENAVLVTVRRAQSNNNEAPTFFANVLGFGSVDISTSAIAWVDNDNCFIDGILVRGTVQFDQSSLIENGACVYGRQGVNFDRDSTVEPGAYIGTLDPNNITYSQGFSADPGSLVSDDLDHPLLDDVGALIDDIENGTKKLDNIDRVEVVTSLPDAPISGTLYVVNGDLHIDKDISAEDIVVAVRGNIDWGQRGSLVNSNGACPSGEAAIGIIATGNIDLNQSARAEGVQLVTGGDFHLHQNSVLSGSAAIAGNAQIDQSPLISPCTDPFANPNGSKPRLVM